MAKAIPNPIKDAMLSQATGSRIHITSAEPANYAGIAAVELAAATRAGGQTPAAGDVNGRKLTYGAESAIPITADGTATHVVLSNGVDTMTLVTTCPGQALTSGGTVDTSAFDHELADPT